MSDFMNLIFNVGARRKLSMAEITLTPFTDGRWGFRVHLCSHEDWSGTADNFDEALACATLRSKNISCTCPPSKGLEWSPR